MGKQQSVSSDLVVCLAEMLWGETVEFLEERGVSREDAGAFADKLRWEIEGLLDYVQ